jgi:hypothetical protein
LAGALLAAGFSGLPLIVAGAMKIVYDLSLLVFFRRVEPPAESK